MTALSWQDAAVALLAAGALGWLAWRRVHARRSATPPCGSCPGCASADRPGGASAPAALVSIGEPGPRDR